MFLLSCISLKKIVLLLVVIILAGIFLFPTYWMIMGSFTAQTRALNVPPDFWPSEANIRNYVNMFAEFPIWKWMSNSLIVAGFVVLIGVLTSCLAGYAFAKVNFIGKELIFWLLMSTLMIPFYSIMIPLFITVRGLGLFNTYSGIILPLSCNAASIFLARQYMSTIPEEILDSSRIDGCSELGVFWRIIMPLSKPLIAALSIFTFVTAWKNFIWPLIITSSVGMKTLPLAIAIVVSYPDSFAEFGMGMAGATILAIPVIIVFIVFQKYFVSGITMGGVKG